MDRIINHREKRDDMTVSYDLRSYEDQRDIKKLADELADVLFKQDVKNWIDFSQQKYAFDPDYRVVLIVSSTGSSFSRILMKNLWRSLFERIRETELVESLHRKIKEYTPKFALIKNPVSIIAERNVSKLFVTCIISDIKRNLEVKLG